MNGIVYYHVFYPGTFQLPIHEWYTLVVDEILVAFRVAAHLEPFHAIDFTKAVAGDASIKFDSTRKTQGEIDFTTVTRDDRRLANDRKVIFDCEVPSLGFSRFYTELIICHESQDTETKSVNPDSMVILERIANAYRIASGDHRVPLPLECRADVPMVRRSVRPIDSSDSSLSTLERLTKDPPTLKSDSTVLIVFDRFESSPNETAVPQNELDSRMIGLLSDAVSSRSREYYSMLSRAIRAFAMEDYKFAFLEAFMLLEVVTADFLSHKKIASGVSKKRLKEFSKDLGISYMINIEIPMFISRLSDDHRELLGEADAIRKKRNDVIHEAAAVHEVEARSAIETIQKLVLMLDQNESPDRRRAVLPTGFRKSAGASSG